MKKAVYELGLIIPPIVGLIIGLLIRDYAFSCLVIAGVGIFSAKLVHSKKEEYLAPYLIGIASFVIGFIIGNQQGGDLLLALIFIISAVISYLFFRQERSTY